jgi:Phage-related protein, tail component
MITGAGGSGGKGGGGSARTPTTARDSLDSTQYAQLIDLISEGEIDGLVNGLQSIYLDNTPIQNPNGTFNFQNVEVYTRNGTQDQEIIPFAGAIEDERSVVVTVRNDGPVTRRITDAQTEAVRITITVPRLERITDKGDTVGESVRLQISVQYNGGGFNVVIDDTISGRTGDAYQRDYLVNLAGAFPLDVRVTRITPDSSDLRLANEFSWSSYTEIIYAKLNYPNSALVGLRIDAEQFSSIPRRAYDIRAVKVRIPSNATVDRSNGRLIYSGVWNGTFGAAQWCSDPAWCLWDLLTKRYGFGDHIDPTNLDKWAFFSASQYCSQLVPDGFGGWEPRFSCNVNIQTSEEAFKLINDMCSVFRAMPYWAVDALTVSQDKPSDPAYEFNNSNVEGGIFTYSNSSLKTRFNVAVVSYFDMETRDIAYEVVEDAESVARLGVLKTEVAAFATNSRCQAHRLGRWLVYTGGETCTFTVGPDAGVVVRPGMVVPIADQLKAGSRRGGRIAAATSSVITVDDASALPASGGILSVVSPSGTVEARPITSRAGNAVTVATPFSAVPNVNSVWLVETTEIQPSLWRVLAVTEEDGIKYKITALEYDPSKYDFIELGTALVPRDITDLNIIPAAPNNLTAQEVLYDAGGRAESKLLISWQPVTGVQQYRIRWRQQSGNWTVETIEREDYEIQRVPPGVYQVEVYSIGANLRASVEPARLSTQTFGKTAPPEDVTGLSLMPSDELSAVLTWNRATALDVLLGGKVLIRHNVAIDGTATWETSQEIVASAAGSQTQKQVPLLEGTYLVKFEDDTGNRSVNPALVAADLPTPQPRLLVQEYAEDALTPPFPGTKNGVSYSSVYDGLVIDGTGIINPVGEYEFGSTLNLGAVYDVNIRRRLAAFPLREGGTWDAAAGLVDSAQGNVDGDNLDSVNALVYVRATMDNPAAAPVWGDWNELTSGIVRGRGFQFKAWATTNDPAVNVVISELGCILELQQRVEQSATITSGAGTYTATYADAFYQSPSVGITGMNMATGDYFVVSGESRTGFSVVFRDSAGTAVSRQFTFTAIGYGRQV